MVLQNQIKLNILRKYKMRPMAYMHASRTSQETVQSTDSLRKKGWDEVSLANAKFTYSVLLAVHVRYFWKVTKNVLFV